MEILINQEKLDFSLENEKNLFDIMKEVNLWMNKEDIMISELKIEGAQVDHNNLEALSGIGIDDVKNVEIATIHKIDYTANILMDLKHYLEKYLTALEEDIDGLTNNKSIKIEGLEWITQITTGICNMFHLEPSALFYNRSSLGEIISYFHVSTNEISNRLQDNDFFIEIMQTRIKEKLEILNHIIQVLAFTIPVTYDLSKGLIRNTNLLIQLIVHYQTLLQEFKQVINDISMQLQTGQDFNAFKDLKKLVHILENPIILLTCMKDIWNLDYTTIYPFETDETNSNIDKTQNIDDSIKHINDILENIYAALKDNDVVLVSDLLEYELGDCFDQLIIILDYLKETGGTQSQMDTEKLGDK